MKNPIEEIIYMHRVDKPDLAMFFRKNRMHTYTVHSDDTLKRLYCCMVRAVKQRRATMIPMSQPNGHGWRFFLTPFNPQMKVILYPDVLAEVQAIYTERKSTLLAIEVLRDRLLSVGIMIGLKQIKAIRDKILSGEYKVLEYASQEWSRLPEGAVEIEI